MALVTSKEILLDAQKNKYAVVACNVENLDMAQAVVDAAEIESAPIILQTTPGTIKSATVEIFAGMLIPIAKKAKVPVVVHLDHGNSFELAAQAIKSGYSSIMIDGSQKSFEENIKVTKQVTKMASALNIPVEAELGIIGGKEDGMGSANSIYTDPNAAKEFSERTDISSLAVAIGTAHGLYKKTPKLNLSCLEKIQKVVNVPLVLHGASGISKSDIKETIKRGICKVNLATELRIQYTNAAREFLGKNQDAFDPKTFGAAGRLAVTEFVRDAIKMCGSQNQV